MQAYMPFMPIALIHWSEVALQLLEPGVVTRAKARSRKPAGVGMNMSMISSKSDKNTGYQDVQCACWQSYL